MSDTIDALSFWGITEELTDFFSPKIEVADYTAKAIDTIYNQYDRINHRDVALLHKLLGDLANYAELMRLNNSSLIDAPHYQQNVYQIFNTLFETMHRMQLTRDTYSPQSMEYATYASALIYSKIFINHHAEQLMDFEPNSLALKWYREWINIEDRFDF